MIIELPYPPSVNTYWRLFRGRMLISRAGRNYKTEVVASVLSLPANERITMTGDVALRLDVYPPDNRRRDIDNVCKAILDALGAAKIYQDDSQVSDLRVVRCGKVASGRVVATIEKAYERNYDQPN